MFVCKIPQHQWKSQFYICWEISLFVLWEILNFSWLLLNFYENKMSERLFLQTGTFCCFKERKMCTNIMMTNVKNKMWRTWFSIGPLACSRRVAVPLKRGNVLLQRNAWLGGGRALLLEDFRLLSNPILSEISEAFWKD